MPNPFSYTGVVVGSAFCNRVKEQEDLRNLMEASQNIVLFSHRRYGKTSLITKIFNELENVTAVYVDLYQTTTIDEFITAFLKGISSIEPRIKRLMKVIGATLTKLRVDFSIDPQTGMPTAKPIFDQEDRRPAIEQIFALIEKLSQKERIVVAFDEFQTITRYGGDNLEKVLRSSIQFQQKIGYIFSGSKRHILMGMFNDENRAFYRQAASYPLEKIATEDYVPWIKGLYEKAEKQIEAGFIKEVVKRLENHPAYVQEFLFLLWPKRNPSPKHIDEIQAEMIARMTPAFTNEWDSFTINQQRALKVLAATGGEKIYRADTLWKFGYQNTSQLAVALDYLMRNGILEKDRVYKIHDPLFRRWVQAG
jgi:uncharacterized protein